MTTKWIAMNLDEGVILYIGNFHAGKTLLEQNYNVKLHQKGDQEIWFEGSGNGKEGMHDAYGIYQIEINTPIVFEV